MKNSDIFDSELDLIQSDSIVDFTRLCLQNAPEYFWTVPSSSTGKYHPAQSNGDGGLVRHTKAVVYFANKLCDVYSVLGSSRDIAIAASILHDVTKYGIPKQKYTTKTHGYEAAQFIQEVADANQPMLSLLALEELKQAVCIHFGRWTKLPAGMPVPSFPEGFSYVDRIVHLADVMSAQKEVSFGFLDDDYKESRPDPSDISMPFGKHAGKKIDEIPSDYLRWMTLKLDDPDLKAAAKKELEARVAAVASVGTVAGS